MDFNDLSDMIKEFGQKIKLNEDFVYAYIDNDHKIPFSKATNEVKVKNYTGFNSIGILLRNKLKEDDLLEINEKNYRVWAFEDIIVDGSRIYTDAIIYENDFIHDLVFYDQYLEKTACNSTMQKSISYYETKARLETLSENSYLEQAYYSDEIDTHVFTILYPDSTIKFKKNDEIRFDNRFFKINGFININEQNKLLRISTEENIKEKESSPEALFSEV